MNASQTALPRPQEYIKHMEEQHQRLKEAWDTDERVVSLKIAIQVRTRACGVLVIYKDMIVQRTLKTIMTVPVFLHHNLFAHHSSC